jgi:hypothetical protein
MLKLATGLLVVAMTASIAWSGWRVCSPRPATPVVASDPFASDAAVRHRQALPNHWRAYMLQPR